MKKSLQTISLVAFFCFGLGHAFADKEEDFKIGMQAWDAGNDEEAFAWFRKAAEQGSVEAWHNLGALCANGQGVTPDCKKAASWLRKRAAEHGNEATQYILGLMYNSGQGVAQNYQQAASWLLKAAEQGNESAQYSIGSMYAKGRGIAQDYIEAHKWLNIAGSNGHADARSLRDEIENRLTTEQIAEAQRCASEWQAKFAKSH